MKDDNLLGAGVLGDSLGSFRDSVLGQLSWEQKTDSSLDFPRGDGVFSVVLGKSLGLIGIGVDLLEDILDVDSVGFLSLLFAF